MLVWAGRSERRGRAGLEPQPLAADGRDEGRGAGVVSELAPDPAQVHVDRLRGGPEVRLPHVAHELRAGDDLPRPADEGVEEVELLAGQVDLALGAPDLPGARVE